MKNNCLIYKNILLTIFVALFIILTPNSYADEKWDQLNEEIVRHKNNGYINKATVLAEHLIKYSKSNFVPDHPLIIRSLYSLASLYKSQGRFVEAEPLYLEMLQISEAIYGLKHTNTLISMINLGSLYTSLGNYKKAEHILIAALEKLEVVLELDHPTYLSSMSNLAGLYQNQGRYHEAELIFFDILTKSKIVNGFNHRATLKNLNNLLDLYKTQARYKDAEQLLITELEKLKTNLAEDHKIALLSMSNLLAVFYFSQGRYSEAEPLYLETLAKRKTILGLDHLDTLTSMNNLANLYNSQGRYSEAEALYLETSQILKTHLGLDHPDTLKSMLNLADINLSQGHYSEAESLYVEILGKYKTVLGLDHKETLDCIISLAGLYLAQDRYNEAKQILIPAYEKLNAISGQDHPDSLNRMNNLALLYQEQGLYYKAEQLYLETISKQKTVLGEDHPDTLNSLNNLAALYHHLARFSEAGALLDDTLAKRKSIFGEDHPDTLISMNNLAGSYIYQSRYKEAEAVLVETLKKFKYTLGSDHPLTLNSMGILSYLYILTDSWSKSLNMLQEYVPQSNHWLMNNIWGASEPTRKQYIKNESHIRNDLLSLSLQQPSLDMASLLVDLSLSRKGLLLYIASQISALSKASDMPELKQSVNHLKQIQAQLSASSNDPERSKSLRQEMATLQRELGATVGALGRAQTLPTSDDLLSTLKSGEALIDFHIYDELDLKTSKKQSTRLLAIVVNPQLKPSIQIVYLGEAEPIIKLVQTLRSNIQSGKPSAEIAAQLYQRLFTPLEAILKDTKHVFISPDGALNLLPFTLLENSKQERLVNQFDLTVVNSPRDIVLAPLKGKAQAPTIVSGPLYDDSQEQVYLKADPKTNLQAEQEKRAVTQSRDLKDLYFNALPGALAEGKAIEGLLKQADIQPKHFSLAQATEAQLKAVRSPRILHLATHGFFLANQTLAPQKQQRGVTLDFDGQMDNRPLLTEQGTLFQDPLLRSGIALAGANKALQTEVSNNKDDGILTALEALSLNLVGTDLVVLSACETGVGEINVGEGVYGLQRSFQEAGAKAVLYTLWPVSDEGTRYFMQRFYETFLAGLAPQAALRKTQREFMQHEKWYAPYYWSGFVVSGKDQI